jgi:hypothetical protein
MPSWIAELSRVRLPEGYELFRIYPMMYADRVVISIRQMKDEEVFAFSLRESVWDNQDSLQEKVLVGLMAAVIDGNTPNDRRTAWLGSAKVIHVD